jgi:hypothetical protein
LNNENNISLQALQNHEVAPPAFLLQSIKSKIADSDVEDLKKTFAPLYNHSTMPAAISFEQIMQKINATDQVNIFKKLNNLERVAPISFASIMARLRELGYFKNSTSAKVISFDFVKKLVAAAAVVLLCIAGYFMYNKTSNTADGASMANNNNATNNITPTQNNSTIDAPVIEDTTIQNTTAPTASTSTDIANVNGTKSVPKERNNLIPRKQKITYGGSLNKATTKRAAPTEQVFTVNGENFTILENDYLTTFASFTPDKLPLFLQAESPVETQITIDKYSYFNVTEGMGAMMKKMYATKSSGAPTRSAKKQKLKLESWKKADSAYFAPSSNLNPLDPRDLGNLILNK